MSNLERWDERGRDSEEEEEEIPSFLRPTAQSARRAEGVKAEMMMVEQRESFDRDQQIGSNYIVNQSEFRNVQVGVGYQHSTVIRQPTVRDNLINEEKTIDKTPNAVLLRKANKRQLENYDEEKVIEEEKKSKKEKKEKNEKKSSKKKEKKMKNSSKHQKKKSHNKHSKNKKNKLNEDDNERMSNSSSSEDDNIQTNNVKTRKEVKGSIKQIETDPTLALDALENLRKAIIKAISQESSTGVR